MSRLGKKAVAIPSGTDVVIGAGEFTVKGKGGTLTKALHPSISLIIADGMVSVEPKNKTRLAKALWGTYAAHVKNMIKGVNEPFTKKLLVEGIGFRVEMTGQQLKFGLGFSHPVFITIPEGAKVVVEKNALTISGADKEVVGQFAANVRALKKPEPYKGKGIRYHDEVIRRKEGKKAGVAA